MKMRAIGLGAIVGFAAGCWRYAPDHCASRDGDASCGDGMFCSVCEAYDNGCVPELPPANCHVPAPEPDGMSSSTSGSTDEVTEGPMTGSTSTPATGSTASSGSTGIGCMSDDECGDPSTPFCGSEGACISCAEMSDPNAACDGLGAGTPICSRGICVECTNEAAEACVGQTPVCTEDGACRACTEHYECPSGACHLDGADVGACFDIAEVVPVANTAELSAVVGGLQASDRAVLVLEPGFYSTTVDIGDSAEVAIIGSSDSPPVLTGDGSRAVEVFGNAIVYLSNVQVSNSNVAGDGLLCTGRAAWVDDSRLDDNRFGASVSSGCFVHARRTLIASNAAGGIECSGGDLSLRNSAVGLNGNGFSSDVGGLSLNNATVDIVYSAVVANQSLVPSEASVSCIGGELGEIRNSIIVGGGDGIDDCAGITFTNNAVDDSGIGGSNVDVGTVVPNWFTGLATGDFHLAPAGAMIFADIAQWQDGDPPTDIDGDPIPGGLPSFPGYDQP